ncbi:MAG: LacI family transcriptional regulator [Balneola sp.]|nr:MAG: LacI family transcriptional regulator [Balneola sp.]
MKVTLKDISDATGFSISTISRAVRGEGRISEENRKKILASAHELGYPLPTNGRAIPKDQPPYIALITQFREGEFYSSFAVGFMKAAYRKNVTLSLFGIDEDLHDAPHLIEHLRAFGFSGAVLFAPEMKEADYQQILYSTPRDFPIISCSNIDSSVLDTVTFDAYQGATLIARHFHGKGYKKLGIIEGPAEMPESRFRSNGFNDYVTHVAEEEIVWSFRGDYTLESGKEAFEAFHSASVKPEAIFATNDAMAVGFMEAASKFGYRFPDDIAIAGYDNLPICETHYPKITSVDTDYIRLGENTLDNLLSRIGRDDEHQGIVSMVPVSLKIRESS